MKIINFFAQDLLLTIWKNNSTRVYELGELKKERIEKILDREFKGNFLKIYFKRDGYSDTDVLFSIPESVNLKNLDNYLKRMSVMKYIARTDLYLGGVDDLNKDLNKARGIKDMPGYVDDLMDDENAFFSEKIKDDVDNLIYNPKYFYLLNKYAKENCSIVQGNEIINEILQNLEDIY